MGIATDMLGPSPSSAIENGKRRCSARTLAGTVCGGWAFKEDPDGFCWAHSPLLVAKRKAGQKRGGRVTSHRMRALCGLIDFENPRGPNAFREALCAAAIRDQIAAGKARDLSAIVKDAEDSRRTVEVADRLTALEETLVRLSQQGEEV